jgi:hypothetical protein
VSDFYRFWNFRKRINSSVLIRFHTHFTIAKTVQEGVQVVDTAKRFKEMTKVSSGALASHKMYQITPAVHEEVKAGKVKLLAQGEKQLEDRAAREQSKATKQQAAQEKRLETAMPQMTIENIKCLVMRLKRNDDSPQKKNRPELESPQLQKRKLRDAEEKEAKGEDLSVLNLRVLVENLRVAGDDNEEALLPKQKEELAAELVRRRNIRDTNSCSGDENHS